MSDFGGLVPTGRELREPADTLLELTDEERIYTAVRYDEVYKGHPALTVGLDLIKSFLEYPMVVGLPEMTWSSTDEATFVFGTGPIWTLSEVLRKHHDIGQVCGIRAGFELAYLATQILNEAGETGPREGVYSHGNLTPGRIALRADGSVQVFGYGLPAVAWICHRDDPDYVIDADAVRYSPPERLTIDAEEPSADTYSLMLIVWEMMTGKPLIEGHDIAKIKKSIEMSEAQNLVSKAKIKGLTKSLKEIIARSLIFDPDTRLTGQELLDELEKALEGNLPGDSLADTMKRIRGKARKTPKGRKIESMQGTGMFSMAQLAAMADEEDEEEDEAAEDKEETRWGKARRGRQKASDDEGDDKGDEKSTSRRRRRAKADEDEDEDSGSSRRRRRRRASDDDEVEAKAEDDQPSRRRRRRKTDDDDGKAEAKADAAEEEQPSRRRRRRKTDDDDEKVEAEAEARDDEKKAEAKDEKDEKKAKDDEKKAEAEKAQVEAEAEDDAAPRRRRRRSTKTDEEPEEKVEAKSDEKDEAEDDAEEASPRRRRRRSPKSDEKVEAKDEKADEKAEEAPRRRRRRRSSEDDDEAEAESGGDEEEKPRRRRRRRTDE